MKHAYGRDCVGLRSSGFSLLELCIALAGLTALAGALLIAVLYQEELAEKASVELTLMNVRSGIRYQIADKMIHGREAELTGIILSNPVNWLERPPPGYVGEVSTMKTRSLQPGDWFFDQERRELGYVPKLTQHLYFASGDARALRWRIRGTRSKYGTVEDLSVESVTAYTWF